MTLRSALRYLPLVVVGIAVLAVFATGLHRSLTPEGLLEHRDALQAFVRERRSLALLAYMGAYIAVATLSIPGSVFLTILGGFLFGWLVGGAAAVVSATIGAIGIFLIARTSIGDALLDRTAGRVRRLAEGFRRDAFLYLLLVRIVPLVPFWLTNLASALFGVPLRVFALATMLGLIPATFAFAVGGSGLDGIIAEQLGRRDACLAAGNDPCPLRLGLSELITPHFAVAIGVLGLLALLPIMLRHFASGRLAAIAGRGRGARP